MMDDEAKTTETPSAAEKVTIAVGVFGLVNLGARYLLPWAFRQSVWLGWPVVLGYVGVWFGLLSVVVGGPRIALSRLAMFARWLLFLMTRWPVLVVWGAASAWMMKMSIDHQGLPAGASFSSIGMSIGVGAVLTGFIVTLGFVLLRSSVIQPPVALAAGEQIRHEFTAGHLMRGELRVGTLTVTSERLVFRPSKYSVQRSVWQMPFDGMSSMGLNNTRLLEVKDAQGGCDLFLTGGHVPNLPCRSVLLEMVLGVLALPMLRILASFPTWRSLAGCEGGDPYDALLDGDARDMRLVMVNGAARFGVPLTAR